MLKVDKKPNPWIIHLKKYRQDNPGLSFKQAIVQAKKTYKTSGIEGSVKVSKIKRQAPRKKRILKETMKK